MPTCEVCKRMLGPGFYYTCRTCGLSYCYIHSPESYCYIHSPEKCEHRRKETIPA